MKQAREVLGGVEGGGFTAGQRAQRSAAYERGIARKDRCGAEEEMAKVKAGKKK